MAVIAHPTLGIVNYRVDAVSEEPDQQVADTIRLMRDYVREDWNHPLVVNDAARAYSEYSGGDVIEAVFWWTKRQLRFVEDELTAQPFDFRDSVVETLIRPVDMAALADGRKLGDCDDYVMYAAALLKALGVESRFVTLAADHRDPTRYSHVYLAAYRDGWRIPLDVSHGPYPGWEAPNQYDKRREWAIFGPDLTAVVGVVIGAAALALFAGDRT